MLDLILYIIITRQKQHYLQGVVEGFKEPNTLGTELQVDSTFHSEGDALMWQLTIALYDNNPGYSFLFIKMRKTKTTFTSVNCIDEDKDTTALGSLDDS